MNKVLVFGRGGSLDLVSKLGSGSDYDRVILVNEFNTFTKESRELCSFLKQAVITQFVNITESGLDIDFVNDFNIHNVAITRLAPNGDQTWWRQPSNRQTSQRFGLHTEFQPDTLEPYMHIVENSSDIALLYALLELKAKTIDVIGLDFYESDYFLSMNEYDFEETSTKEVQDKIKKSHEKIIKLFPNTQFNYVTRSTFNPKLQNCIVRNAINCNQDINKGIFITVRSNSTRLPQKCYQKILDKTTVEYVIENVKKSLYANQVVLCTTTNPEDDKLCEIAKSSGIKYFRGSEHNKWERWLGACKKFNIDFFVTADGDDLFYDSNLSDICFEQYMSNLKNGVVIDGQGLYNDVYGFDKVAIEKIHNLVVENNVEPHNLIQYLDSKDNDLDIQKIQNVPKLFHKEKIRMTLDYPEDFLFFETVINHFNGSDLNLNDIKNYLNENPDVVDINYFLEKSWKENQEMDV